MNLSIKTITTTISNLLKPKTNKTLNTLNTLHNIALDDNTASIHIVLRSPTYLPKDLLTTHVETTTKKANTSKIDVR
jgi:hypothetical protein